MRDSFIALVQKDIWRNPKVWRLLLRSLRQLKQIVEEAHALHDASVRDTMVIDTVYPYRHANNLCWLADDLVLLLRNGQIASPPLIARAMLESLFYLAACKNVPKFAERKTVWEMRDFVRRALNLGLVGGDEPMAIERAEIQAFIERLERDHGLVPNEPAWTIKRCIEECGDVGFLKTNYLFLSQHTHASFLGLSARHDDRHTPLLQQAVLGGLIIGGGFAAELLPNASPQSHVDKATALMAELLRLMASGTLGGRTWDEIRRLATLVRQSQKLPVLRAASEFAGTCRPGMVVQANGHSGHGISARAL